MSQGIEKIAELYYRSGSIGFGSYRWTYHKEEPEAADAPWYLHYPEVGEPGSELLPELHELIGTEFYNLCEAQDPAFRPTKIGAIPNGANPLADAFARQYKEDYPINKVKFEKDVLPDETVEFSGPIGEFEIGDDLTLVDDHVSKSLNKRLILPVARRFLTVTRILTVVDHEMGAAERLAKEDVDLFALMTGKYVLEYGFAEGHATRKQYEEVSEFQAQTRPEY
jgi:orotate phosphoribosyltransferase